MRGRSSSGVTMPPMLRKVSSNAIARDPETRPLEEGGAGGGGVRLHPPHLEEALNEVSDAFTASRPSTTSGQSARSSWGARPSTGGA